MASGGVYAPCSARAAARRVAAASPDCACRARGAGPPPSVTHGDTSAKSRHVHTSIPGRHIRTRRSLVLHPLQKQFISSTLHTPMHAFHHKIVIWAGLSSRGTHVRGDPLHYTKGARFLHLLHLRYGRPAELDAALTSPTSSPKASCPRHQVPRAQAGSIRFCTLGNPCWSLFVNADTANTLRSTIFSTRGVARLIHSADLAHERTALKSAIGRFRESGVWHTNSC